MKIARIILCCPLVFSSFAESDRLTLLRDAVGELVAELTPPPGSTPRDLKKQTWQTPGVPFVPGSPFIASPYPVQPTLQPTQMIPNPQMTAQMMQMFNPAMSQAQMIPVPASMLQMQPMLNLNNAGPMMNSNGAVSMMNTPQIGSPQQFMPQFMQPQNQQMPFQQPQNLRQPNSMPYQQQNQVPYQQQGNLRATNQTPVNWVASPVQAAPGGYFMGMAVPSKRTLAAEETTQRKMSLQEKRDIWDWFVNATLSAGDNDAEKAAVVDELFNNRLRKAPKRKLIDLEELEMANQLKQVLRSGELTTKLPTDYIEASRQYLNGLEDNERSRTMALLQRQAGDDDNFDMFLRINDIKTDQEAPALLLFRILKANKEKAPRERQVVPQQSPEQDKPARWLKPDEGKRPDVAMSGAVSGTVKTANELWERLERKRNQH